jgi:trehalose 6-phosphate phosphatase
MQHLFSPKGEAALAQVMRQRPLLAFDFDGTLAPIVAVPEAARVPAAVSARLSRLAACLPVAIVTGRAVADVRTRLGFEPHYIVGSHGAEDDVDLAGSTARRQALEPLRQVLAERAADLAAAGIGIEDKGQSVALHYRLSSAREQAPALIHAVLASVQPPLAVFAGKMVVNVTAADAPHKAHAVQALLARSGAGSVVFAGDDVNDEPVFVAAPAHWLTVRVGRDDPASRAGFFLDSPRQMAQLLNRMCKQLPARAEG